MATRKPRLWYWYCVQPAKKFRRTKQKREVAVFRGYRVPFRNAVTTPEEAHYEFHAWPANPRDEFQEVVLVGEMSGAELFKLTRRKGTRMQEIPKDVSFFHGMVFRAKALQNDARDAWKLQREYSSRPINQYLSVATD